ncbi:MAG: hypothetical protein M3041_11205 [Acidobacteriota bacterium]|nr:hypothetical protein [Acidobacteriota bacterium]
MREIGELERAARSPAASARVLKLLAALDRAIIRDGQLLARFHDALLFCCAYPASREILRRAESILKRFKRRVEMLDDADPLMDPEVSGIAGTSVDVIFSYDFARWLHDRFPKQLEIDWDDPPDPDRLATAITPHIPILWEEASVDANVQFLDYLRAAGALGRDKGLSWLLTHLTQPLYDSLGIWIRWALRNSPVTRTLLRRRPPKIFFQTTPLLSRRDVSIDRELTGPKLPVRRLSRREGEEVLDMARAALAVRYREVYSFTYGDPSTVVSADCGRGVEILLVGIVPEKRLPIRAGFAPFILRNGVPIGYADAFGICDRMEISFNIFYAFRDGESAFCFARLLKLYHQLFGSTTFSLDAYQVGLGNAEAIEAGAYWFYRKLGFRSTDANVERIARREEQRIAESPRYRTSARILRTLAGSRMIYGAQEWERFHVRNIATKMARRHVSNMFDLISDLPRAEVREILAAKRGRDEGDYLRFTAKNGRGRDAFIRLGGPGRKSHHSAKPAPKIPTTL